MKRSSRETEKNSLADVPIINDHIFITKYYRCEISKNKNIESITGKNFVLLSGA